MLYGPCRRESCGWPGGPLAGSCGTVFATGRMSPWTNPAPAGESFGPHRARARSTADLGQIHPVGVARVRGVGAQRERRTFKRLGAIVRRQTLPTGLQRAHAPHPAVGWAAPPRVVSHGRPSGHRFPCGTGGVGPHGSATRTACAPAATSGTKPADAAVGIRQRRRIPGQKVEGQRTAPRVWAASSGGLRSVPAVPVPRASGDRGSRGRAPACLGRAVAFPQRPTHLRPGPSLRRRPGPRSSLDVGRAGGVRRSRCRCAGARARAGWVRNATATARISPGSSARWRTSGTCSARAGRLRPGPVRNRFCVWRSSRPGKTANPPGDRVGRTRKGVEPRLGPGMLWGQQEDPLSPGALERRWNSCPELPGSCRGEVATKGWVRDALPQPLRR